MGKVNKSILQGHEIIFATKHEKEKILEPVFKALGATIRAANCDTDLFGTFSGEVERKCSVKEALRQKIKLAQSEFEKSRFFLASEGSFGPHPIIGLIPSNLESLLFFDNQEKVEIYVENISTDVNCAEITIGPNDLYHSFLEQIYFPENALIVRPENTFDPIFKNVNNRSQLEQAISNCFLAGNRSVIISTDMRAHCNLARQKNILLAGEKLAASLKSYCPHCEYHGYMIVDSIAGLKCEDCEIPSSVAKEVIYQCGRCHFKEIKSRPDGIRYLQAAYCHNCNP